MVTDYHAEYFAHELSKQHSVADAKKLAGMFVSDQAGDPLVDSQLE